MRCFPRSHPSLVLRSTRYDAFQVHTLVWFSGSPCAMLSMFTPSSGSQVHQVRCFPGSYPCLVLRSTRYHAFQVHTLVWFSGSPCNVLSKFMPLSAFSNRFVSSLKKMYLNLLAFAVGFFHWLNVCIHVHMYIIKWVWCLHNIIWVYARDLPALYISISAIHFIRLGIFSQCYNASTCP